MKAIKTTHRHKGNMYGTISKHGAVERMYSVELSDGIIILEDHFFTLRGAKLAVLLMSEYGVEESFFNVGDWDMIASSYVLQADKQTYINELLKES